MSNCEAFSSKVMPSLQISSCQNLRKSSLGDEKGESEGMDKTVFCFRLGPRLVNSCCNVHGNILRRQRKEVRRLIMGAHACLRMQALS